MPDQQKTASNNKHHPDTTDTWSRLRFFNYFRVALALFFITIYVNDWFHLLVASDYSHRHLFFATAVFYLIASLLFFASISHQKPPLEMQVIVHTLVDICCFILLMHATGGIRSGLGMLLIVSIAISSLFLTRRLSIAFAALASLAVIAEQIYSQLIYANHSAAFTQAGILGMLIFLSALLTLYTARRLKESETLAEEASAELESIVQLNEHIIKSMRTGIMVIKNNGEILMTNNAALELLGHITIDSHTHLNIVSSALHQRFLDWKSNAMQNHQPVQQTQGLPDLQPGFSHIQQSSHSNHATGRTLIFLEDATQLAQRFQQVKLASLGRLTASIAHEIRNPLAAINHAGQLLDETAENIADKKLTSIINTQSKRLNAIVESVLQLSRQQRGTAEKLNLHPWLTQFKKEFISTHQLKSSQLQIKVTPDNIEILFNSSQLHQVMWNLCSNAINHSKKEPLNKIIHIQAKIDEDNKQAYMDIIDNGPGIDEAIQPHIFEPFFTTSNEGSGLGLYITKEVIESNRAKIHQLTPENGGNCFRLYFQQVQ